MKKTIGILAHVDAGKTTLSEQILYNAGEIRTLGRVDDQNTILDSHSIERQRGITVFTDIASFHVGASEYFLVDTPGHVDFAADTERGITVLDYAILVISSVEGIQGHTYTLWDLLKKHSVPVFIFINKTDRIGARPQEIINELKQKFSNDIISIKELTERVAESDEALLDLYLSDRYDETLWQNQASLLINNRQLFICMSGSALSNLGVSELMQTIEKYTYTNYCETGTVRARVFKTRYDAKGNRVSYLKILSGSLESKDKIASDTVHEIRRYTGSKYASVSTATAGELCGVTGLYSLHSGDLIGDSDKLSELEITPILAAKVIYRDISPHDLLQKMRILEDEEPLLQVEWEESKKAITIHVLGIIQLEIIKQLILERFAIEVEFGKCDILYRETITDSVIGSGHFEPLRHYAEVHLKLTPNPPGTGITFENVCSYDVLDKNFCNVICTHVFEKAHKGVLTGSPITDIKITLVAGRAHIKHTEGGDFREAVYRAIRHGLHFANNLLLEPVYDCIIHIPNEEVGRIIADIQRMSGNFMPPETNGDTTTLHARIPVFEALDYPTELNVSTKGKGRISFNFGGYMPCHNAEEVISSIGYDKERDVENTADSVFCSHGSGFLVKWNEAKSYMHCLPE